MKKVLLFGATGNLGKEIAQEAAHRGLDLTLAVRDKHKAEKLRYVTPKYIVLNSKDKKSLENICAGFDVVISALGKSVSINDKSKSTFREIDLDLNSAILDSALKTGVKKFVYVSAFQAEQYLHLEYFNVHHQFSERLKKSGLNYSIIKPPAIFSAFIDLIEMAKDGKLMTIGKGDKKTNPIFEGDLARVCIDSIEKTNATIEAGGPTVYSRAEINAIIQKTVNPDKKVRTVPLGLVKLSLPIVKWLNKNTHDKFAFFMEVMEHDVIAPHTGTMKLEDYIGMKIKSGLA